jgi:hypothetical protein
MTINDANHLLEDKMERYQKNGAYGLHPDDQYKHPQSNDSPSEFALLGCPFCGVEPDVFETNMHGWAVACYNPDCIFKPSRFDLETREKAIELWNKRAI